MPLTSQRVTTIIMEECQNREERFPGYRKELIATLGDILQHEREHRTQGTNIKQKIADKIAALGRLTAESKNKKGQS
jgi:hypothetical protein